MQRDSRIALGLLALLAVTMGSSPARCLDKATADVAVPIQVITPQDIAQAEPFCGRVLLETLKIPPGPALNISRGELRVPEGANGPLLLDGIRIRGGDGNVQPASGPICFEDIEVLKQPLTVLYGDSVAGTVNVVTKPRTAVSTFTAPPGGPSPFFTQPLYLQSGIQGIRGPFDGRGPGTGVDVGGKPGLILAETPRLLYWMLPEGTPHGSVTITLRDAGQGATFPVCVLGLAMSADRLNLLKGESTRMQATVFGPDLLPEEAWRAGDDSDLIDLGEVAKQFPDFKIPKPGDPGRLFLRIDNVSRQTVSLSPSKNESYIVSLDRGNFAAGPYTYTGTVRSKKAGGFTINGIVVAFLAPIAGRPLAPTTPTPLEK